MKTWVYTKRRKIAMRKAQARHKLYVEIGKEVYSRKHRN